MPTLATILHTTNRVKSPIYFFCLFVCLFVFARFPDIGAMESSPNNIKLNGGKVKRQRQTAKQLTEMTLESTQEDTINR